MSDDDEDKLARIQGWRQLHPLLRRAVIATLIDQHARIRLNDSLDAVRDLSMTSALSQMAGDSPDIMAMGMSHGVAVGQIANAHKRASLDNTFEYVIEWLSDGLEEDERTIASLQSAGG